jgi:hypothetical protein
MGVRTRASTSPSTRSGRSPTLRRAPRQRASSSAGTSKLAASRDMLWSPTIRAALIAGPAPETRHEKSTDLADEYCAVVFRIYDGEDQ